MSFQAGAGVAAAGEDSASDQEAPRQSRLRAIPLRPSSSRPPARLGLSVVFLCLGPLTHLPPFRARGLWLRGPV